jgi:subtilisin family serine protease
MKKIKVTKTLSALIFIVLFSASTVFSQENYWVFFKERDLNKLNVVSEKTLKNRNLLHLPEFQESDYGPYENEIKIISKAGANLRRTSKWLNAVSVHATKENIELIKQLPFVNSVQNFTWKAEVASMDTSDQIYLTFPLVQINAVEFFNRGWVAEGVDIGVVDGGFYNLDKDRYTSHLVENSSIAAIKDFFEPGRSDVFSAKRNNGELHGTHVMSYIGGFNMEDKAVAGMALRAKYYLAKTETSGRESRIEEDNWIGALEWLDSLGVRLVNSSLGYALGFTDPKENYSPQQMDGKTSVIGLGAKKAVLEKGMIIVSAAGNEGENKPWKGLVSTPGDVDEVISVGACSPEGLKMGYSSIGPDYTAFVKPDVCVYSTNGTSLAAPVITGAVAAMLQANPALKWNEIKDLLQSAGNNHTFPNNYIGHGWPDLKLIADKIEKASENSSTATMIQATKTYEIESTKPVVVFHKISATIVLKQELLETKKGKIRIQQASNAKFATVLSENGVTEITWKP